MRARIGCLGLVLFWLVLGQGNPLLAAEVNSSATQSKPKTLEDLIGDLRSKKTQVRVAAADALGAMGAAAKSRGSRLDPCPGGRGFLGRLRRSPTP